MKLYKFVPFSKGSKAILINGTIKFSNRPDLNDPFDCVVDIDFEKTATRFLQKDEAAKKLRANPNITQKQKKLSIDKAKKLLVEHFKKNIEESIIDKIGICCFSKKNDNILMWSHYAQNHTGFVVEFITQQDHSNGHNAVNKFLGFSVKYKDEMPIIDNITKPDFDNDIKPLFFTKSLDWQYEDEFRVLSVEYNHGIHCFDKMMISRVIIGAKMSNKHEIEIQEILQKMSKELSKDVPYVKAKMLKGRYKLHIPEA